MAQVSIPSPAKASAGLPESQDFPATPATWYLFCQSKELSNKPLSKTMLGRRLVAYRDSHGRVNMMDASCAHMGADLGRGRIDGDSLECPFHQWSYSSNGQCSAIPNAKRIPGTAKLRTYPVQERHGHVFFFYGAEPLFPLPFFSDCNEVDFVASKPFAFYMDCPWYMLVGNGFDCQHFQAVHDRKLTSEPRVDSPTALSRRMKFEAEVVGTSIFDRLLKRFVGKNVKVSITSWGGPYVLVEGVFGRAHSRLLVASQPVDDTNTYSEVIVFAKKSKSRFLDTLSLLIRRRFTRAFMQYDIDKLSGVRYLPDGLTDHDSELINYFHWLTQLPPGDYEDLNQ